MCKVKNLGFLAVCLLLVGCAGGGLSASKSNTISNYNIGGTITGLTGNGLVLQVNGGTSLPVNVAASSFTFPTAIASGGSYNVTVFSQPTNPSQTCMVTNGSGTLGSSNVANVLVICTTNTYTIGGTVSGLSGTGPVLQDNGANNLIVLANGSFTFTVSLTSGTAYSVTAFSQPSNPSQTCVVTSGSGTVTNTNVTSVLVNCTTNTYTIGGTITGLTGNGLVLQDNGSNSFSISANGNFTFNNAVASGGSYNVTILTQPSDPANTCVLTNGNGTVTSAKITSVLVTCTTRPTYTISGTIMNLAGTGGGLQLQDNGGDNLLVNVNGTFTFPTALASGSTYNVTVYVQPSSPLQTCQVTHGAGTAIANVSGVEVDCAHKEWTWVTGANVASKQGTYGTQGTAAPGNVPGARNGSVSWTDASGNLWLFGGQGYDSAGTDGYLNDLWEYSAGIWTWMGGSNVVSQQGMYGTQGAAAPGNVPGARNGSVTWTDSSGNLWLFGGAGYGSAGTVTNGYYSFPYGLLNDLWEYRAGQWTWVDGSKALDQSGSYGSQGTAAPGNFPGARQFATVWTDASGNFWLLGGWGYDSAGSLGPINDLWEYSAGIWTWMGGSNVVSQQGMYGNEYGIVAPHVGVPGARASATAWTDASGNFWLFGGSGYACATAVLVCKSAYGSLNDLWEYTARQWWWGMLPGTELVNQQGTYGTEGTPQAPPPNSYFVFNVPGARNGSVSWTDASGNLWLFGGQGYDSAGTDGYLNDLWEYSAGIWTWMGGSNVVSQQGMYGTQGAAAPGNVPGARNGSATWTDSSGNLWLFGGQNASGDFNDLWKYEP